eukprot:526889_1
MDDFLGTSIQYAEQQLILLEQQHDAQRERDIEELISSGFLDSDYDGSDGEYTENESCSESAPQISALVDIKKDHEILLLDSSEPSFVCQIITNSEGIIVQSDGEYTENESCSESAPQ